MNNFEYYNPVKVVFGEGMLNEVGAHAAQYGKRALLVTYEECGFFADTLSVIRKSLKEKGVDCVTFGRQRQSEDLPGQGWRGTVQKA